MTVRELRLKLKGIPPNMIALIIDDEVVFKKPVKDAKPLKEHHQQAIELYKKGMGSTEIGKRLNLSKQAVNSILRVYRGKRG